MPGLCAGCTLILTVGVREKGVSMEVEGDHEFTSQGDPVCWIEHVCDECGALVEGQLPATCWRCGAQVTPR